MHLCCICYDSCKMVYDCNVRTYQLFYCSVFELRKNKSLIVAGDEECKSSNFVEVEMLRDGFPLLEK